LKTAADHFVNTPNNVTIDAYGQADLGSEPVVISVPALQDKRYYIVQVGDAFDEIVYNVGGIKGPEPGLFVLTGPDFHGEPPMNMKQIKVRTKYATMAVRVFVNGEADLPAAREAQKGFHALPLSVFQKQGLKYEIPPSDASALAFTSAAPESLRSFDEIGFCMKLYLSASDDVNDPMVVSFHCIGLSVARGFEWRTLDEPTRRGLALAAATAEQIIEDSYAHSAEIVNGWRYTMGGGRAGYDLALRAALASNLIGANVPEQMLYPNNRVDDRGQSFSGANKYELHFSKDELPPVSVFWNLAMYDDKEFFIENDFKRYSIGSTTDGLKKDDDGSITIYIQHDNPGPDEQSNWLPAPAGGFNLTMRMYGPQSPILDGAYHLPAVKRVE
ncbi:MAG: DUF1214 domain-containing protein, partial [Verrucomicrobiota bacterium]